MLIVFVVDICVARVEKVVKRCFHKYLEKYERWKMLTITIFVEFFKTDQQVVAELAAPKKVVKIGCPYKFFHISRNFTRQEKSGKQANL